MINNGSKTTKQTISHLMNSLFPDANVETLFSSHRFCLFFNDIISYTAIGKHTDFYLWAIFFILMDSILFFTALPITFFTTLNKLILNLQFNTAEFINIRISLQQVSIFINIILFSVLFYQWFIFFSFNPNKHLTRKTATLLHITILHLPILISPILGVLYGNNVMCNSNSKFSVRAGILLTLFILIGSIFFLLNHFIYIYYTSFSLTISKGYFSFWSPPFKPLDIVFFYIMSALFALRSGPLDQYVTISGIFGIIYGIKTLWNYKNMDFIFVTARFLFVKIGLDSIFCGIYTIVDIWLKIGFFPSTVVMFIVFFGSTLLSYLLVGPFVKIAQAGISINGHKGFDTSKIRNSGFALQTLRTGIVFSLYGVADHNFLQYIMMSKFSTRLLPDVIRMCIYANIPVDSIYIPSIILSPTDIPPLKFMIFQWKLYENMIRDDNDPVVKQIYKLLEHHYTRAEEILDTFWTENDIKQLNIYQLGKSIREISNDFSKFGSIFKKCEKIQEIWERYASNVMAMPSAKKLERCSINDFLYPSKSVYSYLFSSPAVQPKYETQKSELEKYFRSYQNYNIRPTFGLFIGTTILIVISAITFGIDSNNQTKRSWNNFLNISNVMLSSISMTSCLLFEIDATITYPLTSTISNILNITQDEARLFRSFRINPVSFGNDYIDILHKIPDLEYIHLPISDCPAVSFSLLSYYHLPESATSHKKLCYFFSIIAFSNQLNIICYNKVQEMENSINWRYEGLPKEYFLVAFVFVIIMIFIFFYFAFDRRMHGLFLNAVAYISCSGSDKHFTERRDFSFSFFWQFLNYLGLVLCLIILFYGHYLPINAFQEKVERFSNITYGLSFVCIRLQEIMSAFLLNTVINDDYFSRSDFIETFSNEMLATLNNITHDQVPTVFMNVYPLNNWVSKDEPFNVLFHDWVHFISDLNKSMETFPFLYARLIYMQNFTNFISETIPKTIDNIYLEMQQGSYIDWYISIIGILLSLLFLAIYVYIYRRKKTWYYGASLLLRRRINKDQRFIIITRQILEKKVPQVLDLIPYPAVIEDENNRIIDSNWRAQKYTTLTTRQMVGQHHQDAFPEDKTKDVEFCEYNNGGNQSLLILKDVSGVSHLKEAMQRLIDRFDPQFDLPYENESIYVEIRFKINPQKNGNIFETFNSIEEKYKNIINRISCGVTFYTAMCDIRCDLNVFYEFLSDFINKTNRELIIAATKGNIVCFALTDEPKINMLVSGIPVKRAHEVIISGDIGKLYIDFDLLESRSDPPEGVILMSPLDKHITVL